ncbi:MAG: baseplate J/gp47 family protein [Phycisphaerae bacterium]|nr:baseplate J/gp47 family protein [Phycisphaerae bacterium]
MTTINLVGEKRQAIDYMARDYNGFRQALIDLIPAKLPEWRDPSEADFGIVLIELFAYMADILSYYQDRVANEAFLSTAQERQSVINHLRLIGYEMRPAAPATARLGLIVANDATGTVEVRKGDAFATASSKERRSVTFEYTDEKPLVIKLNDPSAVPAKNPEDDQLLPNFKEFKDIIPVREGQSITNEVIGASDGSPNQQYQLAQPGLLPDSLEITVVTNPPTPAWRLRRNLILCGKAFTSEQLAGLEENMIRSGRIFTPEQLAALGYQERIPSTLAFSRKAEPDYMIETDENDVTTVIFGDGRYGEIPSPGANITANYRVGGGTIGNVGALQITTVSNAPQLQLLGAQVTNRQAASGGAQRESIDDAIRFAPTVFSSMQRSVTADDYVAQAKLFPGVSKARAEPTNWNTIKLYIAPMGTGEPPSDILKRDLLAYFEDKRMLSSFIQIENPDYIRIQIVAQVTAFTHFRNDVVRGELETEVQKLFDFEKVDFKQTLYLSKIYEALEARPGVAGVFVSRFRREDAGKFVFHVGSQFQIDLDNGTFSAGLRSEFTGSQIRFSPNVTVSTKTISSEWFIRDENRNQSYIVRKNQNRLDIYEEQQLAEGGLIQLGENEIPVLREKLDLRVEVTGGVS